MNSGKSEIATSNIGEFATEVAQAVDPSGRVDWRGIHEVVDDTSEVVAHKIALLADLEEVRRIIASQGEVVAIGSDSCLIVSTCGTVKLWWRL